MNKNTEIKMKKDVKDILEQVNGITKLGDLRKIAKDINKDHKLAVDLWASGYYYPRLLAILIMDKKEITQDILDAMDRDMQTHPFEERNNLMDWLMANQLLKDKKSTMLIDTWMDSKSKLQRRAFWYRQGRLRWMGQESPNDTEAMLTRIEAEILQEEPEVQWSMNFTAGWIGVYDRTYRERCIELGERIGLYKDEKVSKGCTPNYLPEFITIEANKRNL